MAAISAASFATMGGSDSGAGGGGKPHVTRQPGGMDELRPKADLIVHQVVAFYPVGVVVGQQRDGGGEEAVAVEGASRRGGVAAGDPLPGDDVAREPGARGAGMASWGSAVSLEEGATV